MINVLLAVVVGFAAGAALRPVVVALAVPAGRPAVCLSCSPPAAGPTVLRLLRSGCENCRDRLVGAPWWLPSAVTAAAFAAVAAGSATGWYAAAQYWIAFLGAALLLVDSAVQLLPDVLTVPAAVGTLVLLAGAAAEGEPGSLLRAVAVAVAAGVLFTAFALGGMGLGDAKLAVSLGALLGWRSWQAAWAGLVLAFALGAVCALVLLVVQRRSRKSTLAFGPALIIGTLAVLALGS
ncbi:A24 family peptidase [Streptomyces sp. CB02959]|uniref:prepilin peptidase n=1 Tax=Streptomyces sp. CB02959 TaxID=2020330 RepID=UPI0021520423|nr:A24 family peptidase [Streptomyces sp. CB02959]